MEPHNIAKKYFQSLGYAENTIKIFIKQWKLFIQWLNQQTYKASYKTAKHSDVIAFQNYQFKDLGKSIKQVNLIILGVRQVYTSLQANNIVKDNPATGVFMKGSIRHIPPPPIPYEDLEQLFMNFPETDILSIRNKAILGLMVYQGLPTRDIIGLHIYDINFDKGSIYIHGTKRSNERILELNFKQFKTLQKYISDVRQELMKRQMRPTDRLILPSQGGEFLNNLFQMLNEKISKINPAIQNLEHIRSSVIVHWCTLYRKDILKVQYMSGHRYISSTEKFMDLNLKDLSDKVNQYFPAIF
jgi:integrase/recombinase XerD